MNIMKTAISFHSRLQPLLHLLVFISAPAVAVDTQFMQGIGDARYHHLESAVIGRGYHIYVMLPDGYDPAPVRSTRRSMSWTEADCSRFLPPTIDI